MVTSNLQHSKDRLLARPKLCWLSHRACPIRLFVFLYNLFVCHSALCIMCPYLTGRSVRVWADGNTPQSVAVWSQHCSAVQGVAATSPPQHTQAQCWEQTGTECCRQEDCHLCYWSCGIGWGTERCVKWCSYYPLPHSYNNTLVKERKRSYNIKLFYSF